MKRMCGLWIIKMVPIFRREKNQSKILSFENKKLAYTCAIWMFPCKIYLASSLSIK